MSESTIEMMLQRIERLERANRAMKFITLGAVLFCVALGAVPAVSALPHGPKAVYGQSFNLMTPKGVKIATLGQTANGGYLAFFDAKGKAEMTVGTSAPDPLHPAIKGIGVAIFDGNALLPRADANPGVARMVWAGNSSNDVATVYGESIFDGNSKVRLSNVTAGDGSNSGTFFYDENETLRGGIGAGNNGPGAFFNDSTGTARLLEGVLGDDSGASLSMTSNNATHTLANLSALGDGSATTLQISDQAGTTRAIAGFGNSSGEIIQLKDANAAETFRAPCTGPACP